MRYTGASLGYQLAAVASGGPAPAIALALLALSQNASWSLALFVMLLAMITIVSLALAGETRLEGKPRHADAQVASSDLVPSA